MCITETWLGTDIDATCISEMVPNGYEFHHVPRSNGITGGGVGIVFKTELSLKVTSSSVNDADTSQFEYMNSVVPTITVRQSDSLWFTVRRRPRVTGLGQAHFSMNGHLSLSTCQSTITTLSSLAT